MSSDPKVLTSSWVFPFTNATCSKQERSCSLRRIRTSRHTQGARSVSTSRSRVRLQTRRRPWHVLGKAWSVRGKPAWVGLTKETFSTSLYFYQNTISTAANTNFKPRRLFWPCFGRSTQPKHINVSMRQRTIANAGIEL